MYLMITSVWTSFENVPNTLPDNAGTNTRDFVAFLIFWLVSLPAIWFPVHQIRHLFTVKAYIVPVAGFAFFGWSVHKAGGLGPIIHQPNSVHGSKLAWAFISGVMSSIANFSTLIVNGKFLRGGEEGGYYYYYLLTGGCRSGFQPICGETP